MWVAQICQICIISNIWTSIWEVISVIHLQCFAELMALLCMLLFKYADNIAVYLHGFQIEHPKYIVTWQFTAFAKCQTIANLAELPNFILKRGETFINKCLPGSYVIPIGARMPMLLLPSLWPFSKINFNDAVYLLLVQCVPNIPNFDSGKK